MKLFCNHEFELVKEISIFDRLLSKEIPTGQYRVYICKKCLKRKKVRL